MDSKSPIISTRNVPSNLLSSKIVLQISNAPQHGSPKRIFTEMIWPALKEDYRVMVQVLIKFCNSQLNEKCIPSKIEGRVKSLDSIEKSLERREKHRIEHHKNPYESLEEIFYDLHDLAGIRIVVDFPSHIDTVNQLITNTFRATKEPNAFSSDRQIGNLWKPWFGAYKSCNHHVTVRSDANDVLQAYCDVTFEVQLTSLPESLYNKLAHPLLYKKSSGVTRKDEMVIDLSHGLALCYSICLLCMQDKLDTPSKNSSQDQALRNAMRNTIPTPGAKESDQDMDALVTLTNQMESSGKSIPVSIVLNALQVLREGRHSADGAWPEVMRQLGSAIQDVNQLQISKQKSPNLALGDTEWIAGVLESAREYFTRNLKNPEWFDFTTPLSAETVYAELRVIEQQREKNKTLIALRRIDPYVQRLKGYASIITDFSENKEELLQVLWGTLKVILRRASSIDPAFKDVVEVLAEISRPFPDFEAYSTFLKESGAIHYGLFLFYRDILDLHAALLDFVSHKRLNLFHEAMGPSLRGEVDSIKVRIVEDADLVTSNAPLDRIKAVEELRRCTTRESKQLQWSRNDDQFLSLSQVLESKACKTKLTDIISTIKDKDTLGMWLHTDPSVVRWLREDDDTCRCIWLQGIPGAGKSFLAANLIRRMQSGDTPVLYAFMDHRNQEIARPIKLLHSLIFQLLSRHRALCSMVHEVLINDYGKLTSDDNFAKDVLLHLLDESSSTVHVVVDGIDEVEEKTRPDVLDSILRLAESHSNLRLLLSSRPERDIEIKIQKGFQVLRVDHHNTVDIAGYVNREGESWVSELRNHCGADEESCETIRSSLDGVVSRANGMFLYAKLVLNMAKNQTDLDGILSNLQELPNGLDDAYGRIVSRLQSLPLDQRRSARRVLLWVATAKYPLREPEMLQAILVKPDTKDFSSTQRKAWLDMRKACGPIIETTNDVVQFVHFTVKEYLFGTQSGSFLSDPEGETELSSTCLTYLAFRSFDSVSSPQSSLKHLRSQVLAGDFVLYQYAASTWLQHVSRCSSMLESQQMDQGAASGLATNMSNFLSLRLRTDLEIDDRISLDTGLSGLALSTELQTQLSQCHDFVTKLRAHQTSHNDDPVMVCAALIKFRQELDLMLCPEQKHADDCVCEKLRQLYGQDTFRCEYAACMFYTRGFATLMERERHLTVHRKAIKCPKQGCVFANLGFSSDKELSRHLKSTHPKEVDLNSGINSSTLSMLQQDDLLQILEGAIMDDQAHLARSVFPAATEVPGFREKLLDFVYLGSAKGSSELMTFLLEAAAQHGVENLDPNQALAVAIDAANIYTTEVLLKNGADVNKEVSLEIFPIKPQVQQQSKNYCTWRGWKQRPVNRAFAMLNSAILRLLIKDHCADLTNFTGLGYMNTTGLFECFKDGTPQVAADLIRISDLFPGMKLVESVMNYFQEEEGNSISILEFFLARGGDLFNREKCVLRAILQKFKSHTRNLNRGQMFNLILGHCRDHGLQERMYELGVESPDLVAAVELDFQVRWKELVLGEGAGDIKTKFKQKE